MASSSASLLKASPVKSDWVKGQSLLIRQPSSSVTAIRSNVSPSALSVRAASAYADELVKTAKTIASPGRGILAMDESNATCGKRLASIGLENTEANRQAYRTLLVSAPGLGQFISGAILFEETLYQSTVDGKKMVDMFSSTRTSSLASKSTRVWCHLLGLTTSHGAKDSTVWPLVPLLTTNKVLVSPNGVLL
ncbi:unnamed protein product [Brassica rapa subsp. trilocularis]